jgi:hypothetical protein
MVCKYHEVLDFIRAFKLLDDLKDEEIKAYFDSFPHACKFDKEIHGIELEKTDIDATADKVLQILDASFEHEYTKPQIEQMANAFWDVFDAAGTPKRPVPFVIVLLTRL